jgi:hypothetical protein
VLQGELGQLVPAVHLEVVAETRARQGDHREQDDHQRFHRPSIGPPLCPIKDPAAGTEAWVEASKTL